MIERYSFPRMRSIWELENKFEKWLEIEILATEAHVKLGVVPEEALKEIKAKAAFSVDRIEAIEAEVHHDVIAFLTNVAENVGPASRYVHYGLTSSDVVDTGLSVQMKEAVDILIEDVRDIVNLLKSKAFEYRDIVCVGRTHGIHAEPMSFGLKFANWAFEMHRNLNRLERAKAAVSVGKLSGAVGTYSNIDPWVEEYVCERLGLTPAPVSTQVLQRDRHAEYMSALALCAATIEKIAVEIRGLQKTETREVEEPFAKGQKGSSAMPHKRNPIIAERLTGLARVIRSNAMTAIENIALWHERDISHSSVERVIIPDSTTLLDYMLNKLKWLIEGLLVYPENMRRNLEKTGGLIFSSRVLLALVDKGLTREKAYEIVQRNAMATWRGEGDLKSLLKVDDEASKYLSDQELDELFDARYFLRNTRVIFERLEKLED
ncbi:MAG: adenylosuccinate lyase [Actinobacteria bacterium]|nr:adenylosuccinate lyase [Actinomycetota bacterium]MBE0448663.1 adenylosuccinate lyase [Actinomycetota bacterium]